MHVISEPISIELIPNAERVTLTKWEDGLWAWEDRSGGATQFKTAEEALKHYFTCRG